MTRLFKNQDFLCLSLIFICTMARVLSTHPVGCLESFDCHSYLKMVADISPNGDIPGHHAVRVFPILLVRALMGIGLSVDLSFHLISGGSYIVFGILSYWVISRITHEKIQALAWSLLLLSFHHALRGPLDVIYQACDALAYPIGLAILYLTYKSTGLPRVQSALAMTALNPSSLRALAKQSRENQKRIDSYVLFLLAVIGTLTRQNLFLLGFLSLVYWAITEKNANAGVMAAALAMLYMALGRYYGDTQLMDQLRSLPPSVFTFQGQWENLKDAHIQDLFIVVLPILIVNIKPLVVFLRAQWHWTLFAGITMMQPFVGYHMTGIANYQRLASQGVWVLILALALCAPKKQWFKGFNTLFLLYAFSVYITWGVSQRWVMALGFFVVAFICSYWLIRESKSAVALP